MKVQSFILAILLITFYGCVQDTQPKTIRLQVDLSSIENAQNVGVRGNIPPLSWNTSTAMTDSNNDGIYDTSIDLSTANNIMEFKFVYNDSIFELDNQDNRKIDFEYQPETISYKAIFNQTEPIMIQKE